MTKHFFEAVVLLAISLSFNIYLTYKLIAVKHPEWVYEED